jgi:hypothetical protein
MFTKALLAVIAALVVTTSFASIASAQRARQDVQTVQPFTEQERNWFLIPEAPERFPNLPR